MKRSPEELAEHHDRLAFEHRRKAVISKDKKLGDLYRAMDKLLNCLSGTAADEFPGFSEPINQAGAALDAEIDRRAAK